MATSPGTPDGQETEGRQRNVGPSFTSDPRRSGFRAKKLNRESTSIGASPHRSGVRPSSLPWPARIHKLAPSTQPVLCAMPIWNHVFVESLTQIETETQAVSYSEVASVALLTWDIIITMGDEIELIWKKGWTPAKGMYIFARYLPWAFQVALLAINVDGSTGLHFTPAQCEKWQIVQAVMLQLIVTAVDLILITRVFALYNKDRRLLVIIGVLFAAELGVLAWVLALVTPRLTYNDDCFVTSSPPLFLAYWITSLLFETVLFVLTLIKFADAVKMGWGRRPVMRDFVSDGTWAYTLIFVTMLINSMLYKLVHSPLAGVCFTWLLSVLSFAGSRLVLNPRRRTQDGRNSMSLSAAPNSGRSIELVSIPLPPLSPTSPHTPRSYAKSNPLRSSYPPRYSTSSSCAASPSTASPSTPATPTWLREKVRRVPPPRLHAPGAELDLGEAMVRESDESMEKDKEDACEPTSPSTVYTMDKPDREFAL